MNKTATENVLYEQTQNNKNSFSLQNQPSGKKPTNTKGMIPGFEPIKYYETQEDKPQYPNYCKYPKNTILPPKNSAGLSGEDALIEGFCYYSPGIFIPYDSEIEFWDVPLISSFADNISSKYNENKKTLIQNFSKIFPIGSVSSFNIGGNKYQTWVTKPYGGEWKFKGYYRKGDRKPYKQPEWVDERNEYQKFVDSYGFAIQITAALATAVAGAMTGGALWVLYAEILIEGGLGVAIGLREIEKGQNVSAALSFITGVLPLLKISRSFRGIPSEEFTQLSKELKNAGLTSSSDVSKYIEFYNGLTPNQQKIMSKLLSQDDITKNVLLKELKIAMSDELPKLIVKEFKIMVEKNPELLKSISFFEKLWVRELSTNSFFIVLGVLVNTIWGNILNAKDLEKLKGVYSVVPEDLKKEIAFNLMSNAEILPKLIKTKSFKSIEKFAELDKKADSWSKWFNTKFKDSIQEAEGNYTELPENKDKAVENQVGSTMSEDELRKLGYVQMSELEDNIVVYDYKKINGVDWFKVNE